MSRIFLIFAKISIKIVKRLVQIGASSEKRKLCDISEWMINNAAQSLKKKGTPQIIHMYVLRNLLLSDYDVDDGEDVNPAVLIYLTRGSFYLLVPVR